MYKYSTDNVNCKDDTSSGSLMFNTIINDDSMDIKTENRIDITENFVDIPKYTDFAIENSSKNLTNHTTIEGIIDTQEEIIQNSLYIENAAQKIEITEHSLELENIQVLEDIYRNYNEAVEEEERPRNCISTDSKIPDNIVERNKSVENARNPKKKGVHTLDSFVPQIPGIIVKQTRNKKTKELQSNTLDSVVYRTRGTIDGKVKKKTNNKRVPLENFERLFIRLERINISDKLDTNNTSYSKSVGIKVKSLVKKTDTKLKVKRSTKTVDKKSKISKTDCKKKIEEILLKSLNKKKHTSLIQTPVNTFKDVPIVDNIKNISNQGTHNNNEIIPNLNKDQYPIIKIEPKITREVTFDKKNKTYYQCFYCNKCFPVRQYLVHHMKRTHFKEKKKEKELEPTKYECYHCGKVVKHRRSIVSHITQWHSQRAELFYCAKCTYVTKLKQALRNHVYRRHISNDEKPIYKCHICPHETTNKYELQKHIEKVHEKRIKMKKCKLCDWEGDIAGISCHMRSVHSDEKYFCDTCSYQTNIKGNLAVHQRKHMELKEFRCPKCPYQTNSNSRLKNHVRWHEVPLKKCPECFKMVRESGFYSHIRLNHRNRTKEKCPQCEKEVLSLTKHLKTHNGGYTKFKCPECNFMCANKNYLNVHIQKYHEESKDGLKRFICNLCNKELHNKAGLVTHIKSVHTNNPCECPTCGKQLKSTEYLASHLRKMHSNNWYECKLCPEDNVYRTKHKRSLRNHMLQKHDIKEVILYKCKFCPYETKVPEYFKTHVSKSHKRKSKKIKEDPVYSV